LARVAKPLVASQAAIDIHDAGGDEPFATDLPNDALGLDQRICAAKPVAIGTRQRQPYDVDDAGAGDRRNDFCDINDAHARRNAARLERREFELRATHIEIPTSCSSIENRANASAGDQYCSSTPSGLVDSKSQSQATGGGAMFCSRSSRPIDSSS